MNKAAGGTNGDIYKHKHLSFTSVKGMFDLSSSVTGAAENSKPVRNFGGAAVPLPCTRHGMNDFADFDAKYT